MTDNLYKPAPPQDIKQKISVGAGFTEKLQLKQTIYINPPLPRT